MSDEEIKLTRFERYRLANELRILEALYPDEADDFAVQREALERGYELFYGWHMEHIYDGESVMSAKECLEVWDTLDMFDGINRAIKKVGKPEYREHFMAMFRGYDGNNESKFMGFARYTIERLKRFDYIPLRETDKWNSHAPVREMYGRMREVWEGFGRDARFEMSEAQLRHVLEAADHPDNRPA